MGPVYLKLRVSPELSVVEVLPRDTTALSKAANSGKRVNALLSQLKFVADNYYTTLKYLALTCERRQLYQKKLDINSTF